MITNTRTSVKVFTFTVVIFCCCVFDAVGLKCLQCVDPKPDGPCASDYKTLVNTSREIFPNNTGIRPYYKECLNGSDGRLSNVTQNYCVIEVFYVGGEVKSLIRDCSDGKTFSFTGTIQNAKLQQVAPDNFTTCIYQLSANVHVCISLCAGDFCNGPRPPPNRTTELNCTLDEYGFNSTCGAQSLTFWSSHGLGLGLFFGSTIDGLLGQVFFLPVLTSLVFVHFIA